MIKKLAPLDDLEAFERRLASSIVPRHPVSRFVVDPLRLKHDAVDAAVDAAVVGRKRFNLRLSREGESLPF